MSKLSRSVAGKVVVITGAASGMGRATAHLFEREGAKVAAIDVNARALAAVVGEIEATGASVRGWTVDLSDADAIRSSFDEIAAHFHGIDILVNNAGISRFAPIDSEDYEAAWDLSLSVLLTAHTRTIRAALAHLRQAEHHQHRLHRRAGSDPLRQSLHCGENRRDRSDPIPGGGAGR